MSHIFGCGTFLNLLIFQFESAKIEFGGKVWSYSYTSENQLRLAELYDGTTKLKSVELVYDVMGRRIKKVVSDLQNSLTYERKYVYDGSNLLAELNEDNDVLVRYTNSGLGVDDVLSVDVTSDGVAAGYAVSSGSYNLLKDSLGSIQAITNSSGVIIQRFVYSAYGKLLKVVDSAGNTITPVIKTSLGFTGRELDSETGLNYYRARYYDPHSGRFMQEDPHPGLLVKPMTFNNRYGYVENMPLNYIDPHGLFKVSLGDVGKLFVTGVLGNLVGYLTAGSLINNYEQDGSFQDGINGVAAAMSVEVAIVLLAWLSPVSAAGTGLKSISKALMTKGSLVDNLNNNFQSEGTSGAFAFSFNDRLAPDWLIPYTAFIGLGFTVYDLGKQACSKDSTTFARTNLCVSNL